MLDSKFLAFTWLAAGISMLSAARFPGAARNAAADRVRGPMAAIVMVCGAVSRTARAAVTLAAG